MFKALFTILAAASVSSAHANQQRPAPPAPTIHFNVQSGLPERIVFADGTQVKLLIAPNGLGGSQVIVQPIPVPNAVKQHAEHSVSRADGGCEEEMNEAGCGGEELSYEEELAEETITVKVFNAMERVVVTGKALTDVGHFQQEMDRFNEEFLRQLPKSTPGDSPMPDDPSPVEPEPEKPQCTVSKNACELSTETAYATALVRCHKVAEPWLERPNRKWGKLIYGAVYGSCGVAAQIGKSKLLKECSRIC